MTQTWRARCTFDELVQMAVNATLPAAPGEPVGLDAGAQLAAQAAAGIAEVPRS